MDFDGDMGTLQRRIAEVPEGYKRRLLAFEALDLGQGMRVLEIGCGGGHLANEIASAVGASGHYTGLDASDEQLAAARAHCAEITNTELVQGDATNLPFDDGAFDRVVAINTLEYIPDTAAVLGEMHRVLNPGGRLVNISVLWDHWQIHGADAELTAKFLDVFRSHCHHQMLPLELPRRLNQAGFGGVGRELFTFLNTSLHEKAFGYWAAKVLCAYASMKGVPDEETTRFMKEVERADRDGRFGFFNASVVHWAERLP